jgi:hypothetical protein
MVAQIYDKSETAQARVEAAHTKMMEFYGKDEDSARNYAEQLASPRGQAYIASQPEGEQFRLNAFLKQYGPGTAPGAGAMSKPAQAQSIAEGITTGRQPPVVTGLYGLSGQVRADLEKKGFNLAEAQLEWQRATKQVQSLNGPQMTRFVGLAHSVDSTINEVRNLSKQMNMSGVPALNSVELQRYIQTEGNSPNGQLAIKYVSAVNTLKEEFANLANGGYAPTEPAWTLANQQINGNYGVREMDASLTEVQRLINYRLQGVPGLSTLGPGAPDRYTGGGAVQAPVPAQGGDDGWGEVKVH